ncbi:MAG: ABC transporter permease subunit [Chlorobi bacterium]|nr:ABC transporter permease subunit [Chlorobiota bacterium]
MNDLAKQIPANKKPGLSGLFRSFLRPGEKKRKKTGTQHRNPFRVMVEKEISDQVRSLRFIILISIIALTTLGSLYTALTNIASAINPNDPAGSFLFLKLYTISDGTLPPYIVYVSFLGPLLGIGLGFDAINQEQSRGTLSRLLAQPIHRDFIINAKFVASLFVISVMFFALAFLVMGIGIISIGIPPTAEEFIRILIFILLSIIYVAFWLNLSIIFSVQFRQPATSALAGLAVWLFFVIFYPMIINLITKAIEPSSAMASAHQAINFDKFRLGLLRLAPNVLFSEATSTLLTPTVRSLGPLTMEQLQGTIPGPLPLGQSIFLIWPHLTALISATVACFVFAYVPFMRKEIRSR